MHLSPPKQITFIIGAVLWLLGLLGLFIPAINNMMNVMNMGAAYWLAILGGLVLILGNMLDGI